MIVLEADQYEQDGAGTRKLTATVSDDYGPVERVEVIFKVTDGDWEATRFTESHTSVNYGKAFTDYGVQNVGKTHTIVATEQVTQASDSVQIVVTYEEPGCVVDGTLITLADGSQKAVEDLTGEELLLVWNLFTGTFDVAPIIVNYSEFIEEHKTIGLHFSDGTEVRIIDEHAFWDFNLDKYVFINEHNVEDFVGHWFQKQVVNIDGSITWVMVQLTDYDFSTLYTRAWTPITSEHLSFYANGMLSMTGEIEGLVNVFDVTPGTMKIDQEAYLADVAEYGLFTYEEFSEYIDVPEIIFDAFQAKYFKVAMGKGILTWDKLFILVEQYGKWLGIDSSYGPGAGGAAQEAYEES